jgi:hypothetical protein
MIKGTFHLATVRPNIDVMGNQAYSANDVLFDWHAFEIPRGGCRLTSLQITMPGTNGADANVHDIDLLFGKSINGVAPTSLGAANSAVTLIKMTSSKNNIMAYKFLDADKMSNNGDFIGYNVWSDTAGINSQNAVNIVLEGDPNYTGTTVGYQTIWIAAVAQGAFDFGTGILNDGAKTSGLTLDVSEDVDADDVFDVGDQIMSIASNGDSPVIHGSITSLTADAITIDELGGSIGDDHEIIFRAPITFNLGFEY